VKELASGVAGFCGLWSKMGEKPPQSQRAGAAGYVKHEFSRIWDCIKVFVLYYLTNFSPDGEL